MLVIHMFLKYILSVFKEKVSMKVNAYLRNLLTYLFRTYGPLDIQTR